MAGSEGSREVVHLRTRGVMLPPVPPLGELIAVELAHLVNSRSPFAELALIHAAKQLFDGTVTEPQRSKRGAP